MPQTNTDLSETRAAVIQQVERSMLLSAEQKNRVLVFVESATDTEIQSLHNLLSTETQAMQNIVRTTVQAAAMNGHGSDVTKQIDLFFRQADQYLRKVGGGIERDAEKNSAEQLLDAA